MPNWCDNRVTISSNTEDDSQFKELVAKFQVERPFNEIYPKPDFTKIPNSKGELPIKEVHKNDNGHGTSTPAIGGIERCRHRPSRVVTAEGVPFYFSVASANRR